MRTFLTIAAFFALAIVPLASAGGAGANAYSYGYGDCNGTYGYAANQVGGGVFVAGSGASGNAGSYCYTSSYWYTYRASQIGGTFVVFTPVGYEYANVYWYSFTSGSYSYCDSGVAAFGIQSAYQSLGCPAGAPPTVAPVLP